MKTLLKKARNRLRKAKNHVTWEVRKRVRAYEGRLVADYLRRNKVRKLQIGCGGHAADGWLNTNYESRRPGVIFLDATKPFPIGDGVFDFIFSEHMIEHVSHSDAIKMLAECWRIIRPGGVIRISTPDLEFLCRLHNGNKSGVEKEYVGWSMRTISCGIEGCDDVFVINNYFRAWGHQFIYDEKTLRASLRRAGFSMVTRQEIGCSDHEQLRGLENEARMPMGYLKLESLILEAVKARPE